MPDRSTLGAVAETSYAEYGGLCASGFRGLPRRYQQRCIHLTRETDCRR
jgi:hypothetical protein